MNDPAKSDQSNPPPTLAEQARKEPLVHSLWRELWAILVLYCAVATVPLLFGLAFCE